MKMIIFNVFKRRISSTVGVPKRFLNIQSENLKKLSNETWDIIISGGGMVGCSLACALGSSSVLSGKKVLLLESSTNSEFRIEPNKYSNRVCALNPGTKRFFDSFGVWKTICSMRAKEVKKMQIWESNSDARIDFQQGGMMDNLAYIVENDVILNALALKLSEIEDKVQILRGAKVVDYVLPSAMRRPEELVTVNLPDGVSFRTRLLVGADGVHSLVRRKMDVKYISWNYNQKAIVATLKLSEPTENIVAWQRFLPSGPIALLPLTDDMCSLVWTVSLPMFEELRKQTDEQFVDYLNSVLWTEDNKNSLVDSAVTSFKSVLSAISPDSGSVRQLPPSILSVEGNSRAAFPLGLGHATEYVASRVALIGDAAHRVHPLAGQGVNLGFGDVQCLVECLETSIYNGENVGSLYPLLDYEVKRQRHVIPTMFAIDALNRLYKTEFAPFVLLRSLGVTALDALYPIKERIMQHASM